MKNKKNLLFALIGAGTLVLSAGVGFATWTINSTSDKNEDTSLKLSADATVTDNRIVLEMGSGKTEWTDNSVKFIPVKKASYSPELKQPIWLDVSSSEKEDDLTAKYHVAGKAQAGKTISIKPTFSDTTKEKTPTAKTYDDIKKLGIKTIRTTGIVGDLPVPQATTATVDDKGAFSADIIITFSWGEAFGGKNPYEYYNSKDYIKDLGDEAKTNIENLQYLPQCSFKLEVEVSVQA